MHFKKNLTILASLALLTTSIVYAHSGATGIVKQRMDAMKELGRHSKQINRMFRGQAEFNKSKLNRAADLFLLHGEEMLSLFPDTEHSRSGTSTEALPAIWENHEDFAKEVNAFIEASRSLQQAAQSTDNKNTLRNAFMATGKSCKSCHKAYRKPKR